MSSKIKNLVEYFGLADELPVLDNPSCFKQFCLQESLVLPEAKPDFAQLVKVVSEASILDTRIVRTPKATSLEGQRLTGFKLLIDGVLRQKTEYVADIPSQAVHAVHFSIPFSTFVILPENFKCSTAITATAYIEDISVEIFDKRTLFKNVMLLVVADF